MNFYHHNIELFKFFDAKFVLLYHITLLQMHAGLLSKQRPASINSATLFRSYFL